MYSETSLIRQSMDLRIMWVRRLLDYGVPLSILKVSKYGKRHSIIQQPPKPTLFSGPIECRIREVSLYCCSPLCLDVPLVLS